MVKAIIRLQRAKGSKESRLAFVPHGCQRHGIYAGVIRSYEVTGNSWSELRRVLKTFEVFGRTGVNHATVEAYFEDIGHAPAALRKLDPDEDRQRIEWGYAREAIQGYEKDSKIRVGAANRIKTADRRFPNPALGIMEKL